jgi:DNA-directed RNA polymerase subunit omega
MLPSPDILNHYPYGKFVLSNLAAKRAKQLKDGAPPLVRTDSNHPLTIALAEIAAGKIKPILPAIEAKPQVPELETAVLIDEAMPAEFGMLLPALDETEAALVTSQTLVGEEEHEPEEIEEVEPSTLADLLGAEEEEEVVPPVSDDDTLSLSDIAEQETSLEGDEPEE